MGKLFGRTVGRETLSKVEVDMMYKLMTRYYNNVNEIIFQKDLMEKDQVILLEDSRTGELRGFSTFMSFDVSVDCQSVRAIFSGDTIVEREYWGDFELLRSFCRYLNHVANTSVVPAYWFLICKGYKTYRYLPLNFKQFYPRYDTDIPQYEKSILDALAFHKYPLEYDAQRGIIGFSSPSECLKEGVAEITEARLSNPHIKFFLERNPSHQSGDELACVARLSHENFTKAFYRSALYRGGLV